MDTSDWITLGAAILTGGGTLFLAVAAFRSIRENRRIRVENRELEIKAMALNNMKSLALEFQQLVFLAGTSLGHEKRQFGTRYTSVLQEYSVMVKYADLFSEQLKEKAKSLADCIGDFNKELTKREVKDDELMFVLNTKERVELRDRVLKSVDELCDAITKEKIKLYTS